MLLQCTFIPYQCHHRPYSHMSAIELRSTVLDEGRYEGEVR